MLAFSCQRLRLTESRSVLYLLQINLAEAVVQHAGRGPARGGNVEDALTPVSADACFDHAGPEQDAQMFAEVFRRATRRRGALADVHLASIGEQLDDRPAHRTGEGEERVHRIELWQAGWRVWRRIGSGIAHLLGSFFNNRSCASQMRESFVCHLISKLNMQESEVSHIVVGLDMRESEVSYLIVWLDMQEGVVWHLAVGLDTRE